VAEASMEAMRGRRELESTPIALLRFRRLAELEKYQAEIAMRLRKVWIDLQRTAASFFGFG
jgi:hypothetical protein